MIITKKKYCLDAVSNKILNYMLHHSWVLLYMIVVTVQKSFYNVRVQQVHLKRRKEEIQVKAKQE